MILGFKTQINVKNMKKIEETFTTKIGISDNLHITARNYNLHILSINGRRDTYLTTEDMRHISNFLTETADKIDSDPDYNNTTSKVIKGVILVINTLKKIL